MQVQVKLLLDQEGQRLDKAAAPVEGGWEFVRRKGSYFYLRDFFGGIEMQPPGRLWEPVLIEVHTRAHVLIYRGFQIVGKAARAQEWSIYVGKGVTGEESVDNRFPSARYEDIRQTVGAVLK